MKTPNETLSAVGTILAASVLIDERRRDVEMIEFSHSITTINHHIRPDVILPRSKILAWFKENEQKISENLSHDSHGSWKTSILNKIEDKELRRLVLAAMFSISVCDYELNDEECEFLKLAVSLWKTDLPHVEEMAQMVG